MAILKSIHPVLVLMVSSSDRMSQSILFQLYDTLHKTSYKSSLCQFTFRSIYFVLELFTGTKPKVDEIALPQCSERVFPESQTSVKAKSLNNSFQLIGKKENAFPDKCYSSQVGLTRPLFYYLYRHWIKSIYMTYKKLGKIP